MIHVLLAIAASLLFALVSLLYVVFGVDNRNKKSLSLTIDIEEGANKSDPSTYILTPITPKSSKPRRLWKQLAKDSYLRALTPETPQSPLSPSNMIKAHMTF
ncbi:methionine tRS [Acrasis kona]|uniref:Methionine tRS n=1 Tax=Acrasis kona TaxID=1008807 RepID=A0AAW2ZHH3_9EUKA